jgi:hypothetical protein
MTKDSRKRMLDELQGDLDELLERRAQLDREIARVRQAIVSLDRIATDTPARRNHDEMQELLRFRTKTGLKDMIIEVLRGAYKPLTPAEVARGLEQLRYYFGSANKTGIVTVTLTRLVESGVVRIQKVDGKKAYVWQG